MNELDKMLELLVDNKLVRRKLIENGETKYFAAIPQSEYDEIIEKDRLQKSISPTIEVSP